MRIRKNCLLLSIMILLGCSSKVTAFTGEEIVALLGDSMTWIGGNDCEKETGWSHYLKEAFPSATIDMYARSGATWTNTRMTKGNVKAYSVVLDNENVLYNQILRLINASSSNPHKTPDLIILFAGANDALYERRRPGLFNEKALPEGSVENCKPFNYTTLSSSVELGCRLLKSHFPDSRIILVTPVEMSRVLPSKINRVGDVIEKTGAKLGIEVLRADKNVDIRHEEEKTKPYKNTYDGIHSNPAGARLIANYIIENLSQKPD